MRDKDYFSEFKQNSDKNYVAIDKGINISIYKGVSEEFLNVYKSNILDTMALNIPVSILKA